MKYGAFVLKGIIDRLTSPFSQFGLWVGLAYLIDRTLSRLCCARLFIYDLMVQPIVDRDLVPSRFVQNLTVKEIGRGDPLLAQMPPKSAVIESRFDQGAFCLVALVSQQMVGYIWLCPDAYEEDEVRCRFVLHPSNQAVFDFDVYVMPEQRLGLAFAGLWNGANRFLYERGVRHSFSRLTRFNIASRRAHGHFGLGRCGRAVTFKAGRFELMLLDVAPYLSATIRRVPEVHLYADRASVQD